MGKSCLSTVHDRDVNAAENIRKQGILKYDTAGTAGIQAERLRALHNTAEGDHKDLSVRRR